MQEIFISLISTVQKLPSLWPGMIPTCVISWMHNATSVLRIWIETDSSHIFSTLWASSRITTLFWNKQSWFDRLNNIWWKVKIMDLLIMKPSPDFSSLHYLIPLRFKYSRNCVLAPSVCNSQVSYPCKTITLIFTF